MSAAAPFGGFFAGTPVVVGGGCGFLGSYLVPQLIDAGALVTVVDDLSNGSTSALGDVIDRVTVVEADLRDPAVCAEVVIDAPIVLNLAAKAFGMEYSRHHNAEMLIDNLLSSLTLMQAARAAGVRTFLAVSSSCVYPDDAEVPTPELPTFTGAPESVNEGYGWAKRVQELAAEYLNQESDMRVTVVRPFNPYGGHYRWGSEAKAHVIPALVKRVMDGENPLVVWGSGQQRRNFLHASDATRLILRLVASGHTSGPVNVGYDDDVTIAELVGLICRAGNRSPQVVFDRDKPEGRFRKAADATLLRRLTDDEAPRVSLELGIAEMIEWYASEFSSG